MKHGAKYARSHLCRVPAGSAERVLFPLIWLKNETFSGIVTEM